MQQPYSKIVWVVFWKNPKKGIGKLGLVAVFDSREAAENFIYSKKATPEEWNELGIESCPMR